MTLVHHVFRQVGRQIARLNAEAQYEEASPTPQAALAEHLDEFDDLWNWTAQQWHTELSDTERQLFDAFDTETDRDTFRIVRSFAQKAACDGTQDFPISVEHLAGALGVSYQAVSKIRKRFVELFVIEKTADHVANRAAARFRWLLLGTSL